MIAMYTFQILQVLFLFLAGFFSIMTVEVFYQKKHKEKIMKIKRPVFVLLMFGILTFTIAFSMKHIYSYIYGDVMPLVSDMFFFISYMMLIVAFLLFWIRTRSLHKLHQKEPVFIIGVVSLVMIWLFYLFTQILVPGVKGLPTLNHYFTYFYPAAATFLFFTTLIIHPMKQDKVIRTPLWYLSAGVFLDFLAEMMYIYTKWNLPSEVVQVIYSLFFMFAAFYFMLGFYASWKKYR